MKKNNIKKGRVVYLDRNCAISISVKKPKRRPHLLQLCPREPGIRQFYVFSSFLRFFTLNSHSSSKNKNPGAILQLVPQIFPTFPPTFPFYLCICSVDVGHNLSHNLSQLHFIVRCFQLSYVLVMFSWFSLTSTTDVIT